jgi:predicted nucleotidyltransferase
MRIDHDKLKEACQRFDLSLVVLFGSHAKGSSHPRSDIDLGVMPARRDYDARYILELLAAFRDVMGSDKIDLTMLDRADPLLHFSVASQGVPLYEKGGGEFIKFKARATQRNNDAKKYYEMDRLYVEKFLRGEKMHVRSRSSPAKTKKA